MARVPELRGGDVILTGHDPREAAAHAAAEDEETARRFGWWPARSTEQTVLAAYETWDAQWRDGGPRRAFATRVAVTGDLVGGCELQIGLDGTTGEVSYWTHADQRGRGYAKQALALLCDYAASIGVTRLEAHVAPDNRASRGVAESAGFTESGFADEHERYIRYVRIYTGYRPTSTCYHPHQHRIPPPPAPDTTPTSTGYHPHQHRIPPHQPHRPYSRLCIAARLRITERGTYRTYGL